MLNNTSKCSKIITLYIETKALSTDQIIAKFPHTNLPVNEVKPYYQSIHDILTLLYGNAYTLTTKFGEVNNEHIELVMRDTLCRAISAMAYETHMNPGRTDTVPLQATTAHRLQLLYEHT